MEQFLKDSPQIKITPHIKKISQNFKKEGLDLVLEILQWVNKNVKEIDSIEEKNKLFRQRTAEEIIKKGKATGCTDYALVFIALARSKKIPTKYVETIRRRRLDIGADNQIEGHVFAECLINGEWYIIDPQESAIRIDYRRFVIFKVGLDSWDIGIKNIDQLSEQFLKFRESYQRGKK